MCLQYYHVYNITVNCIYSITVNWVLFNISKNVYRCTLYSKQSIPRVQKCVYSITVRSNYNSPQIVYSNTFTEYTCMTQHFAINIGEIWMQNINLLTDIYCCRIVVQRHLQMKNYIQYMWYNFTVIIMYTQIASM